MGLAVSIILTFANRGHALLATCTFANVELIQISHECPFDPTRVYVSARERLRGPGDREALRELPSQRNRV